MAEYTYKDIIIDPNSEEAKNAVGKEVFFDNMPYYVVNMANADAKGIGLFIPGVLKDVIPELQQPFRSESGNSYSCIILKKENTKPQYVPFESAVEFVKEYRKHIRSTDDSIEDTLHCCGMWIRNKHSKNLCQVVFIVETGVRIGGQNYGIDWNIMLKDFKFLDGSPCGKEVK